MALSMQEMILAITIALAVALILGPILIPLLHKLKFGQHIRDDGPARHFKKAGTPTMGGLIFIAATLIAGLIIGGGRIDTLVVLGALLGFGLIGFLDDFIKVALKRSLGLRAREKLLGQIILAAFFGVLVMTLLQRGSAIAIPFSQLWAGQQLMLDLGPSFYVIFSAVLVVGMANAVNLTDGLDGLATGTTVIATLAMVPVAILSDRPGVALAMLALAGGCLGFLFYNRYPAKVFMGDTGSLALGGALAVASLITGSELLLLIIGGVFVLETLSVIIQVFSFQVLGRRVFRMSPLHHHFELVGWSEVKVVGVFWLMAVLFALLALLHLVIP